MLGQIVVTILDYPTIIRINTNSSKIAAGVTDILCLFLRSLKHIKVLLMLVAINLKDMESLMVTLSICGIDI
jgi:hypothetical protein